MLRILSASAGDNSVAHRGWRQLLQEGAADAHQAVLMPCSAVRPVRASPLSRGSRELMMPSSENVHACCGRRGGEGEWGGRECRRGWRCDLWEEQQGGQGGRRLPSVTVRSQKGTRSLAMAK